MNDSPNILKPVLSFNRLLIFKLYVFGLLSIMSILKDHILQYFDF